MSIKLTIDCEDAAEATTYLSAPAYYNLISDFSNQIRSAYHHGGDILEIVETYKSSFYEATDHHQGPY